MMDRSETMYSFIMLITRVILILVIFGFFKMWYLAECNNELLRDIYTARTSGWFGDILPAEFDNLPEREKKYFSILLPRLMNAAEGKVKQ